MDRPPVLEMQAISKEFSGVPVLQAVDLTLRAGEIHALLGENGAGKSTLMNVLFGMPDIAATGGFTGQVRVAGRPVHVQSPAQAMGLGIGMVHQEFMLIPGFRIYENIKLNREPVRGPGLGALRLLDVPRMRADAVAALERVRLDVDANELVGALPVGHMQFIEIAREVDKQQLRVLVFDEPTAVLAETEAERLLAVMRELAAEGVAILFITHRLDEVLAVADTVTVLRDGQRVFCGPRSQVSAAQIASTMVGHGSDGAAPVLHAAAPQAAPQPALEVRDLRVEMPGEVVRGVDLDLRAGEILGIGGLAGQGKVGIANGLMGMCPAEGNVRVHGEPLQLGSPRQALAAGLAFVSEDRRGVGLLLDESIERNIGVPAVEVHKRFLRGRALGPFAWVDRPAMRSYAEQMIERLHIRTTGPQQVVRRLSGGNQQKVCLARALVLEPNILLVSEPTRGIDVGAKQLVLDLLVDLNREHGLSVLMTSSELSELRAICHRVAIISEGRVAGILAPDAPDAEFGLLMGGGAA